LEAGGEKREERGRRKRDRKEQLWKGPATEETVGIGTAKDELREKKGVIKWSGKIDRSGLKNRLKVLQKIRGKRKSTGDAETSEGGRTRNGMELEEK